MNVHTNCVCGMYHSPQIQQKQTIDENGNMVTRDVLGDRHWWELECLEYLASCNLTLHGGFAIKTCPVKHDGCAVPKYTVIGVGQH